MTIVLNRIALKSLLRCGLRRYRPTDLSGSRGQKAGLFHTFGRISLIGKLTDGFNRILIAVFVIGNHRADFRNIKSSVSAD